MISLKKLGVVGIAAALSLSFAACSKGGGAQATSNSTAASSGLVELSMWTHNAGNKEELAAVTSVVNDFNASQTKYQVKLQAFPQDSYNQSVTAAAAAKKLPCVFNNWAVFYQGKFVTVNLLDAAALKRLLKQ